MIKRRTYKLTDDELATFGRLLAKEGVAFGFWGVVAAARELDSKSIIGHVEKGTFAGSFSALPLNHGKHWCWPHPLNLSKAPTEFSFVTV